MAVLPLNIARVSNLMRSNIALGQLNTTEGQLLRVQNELTTGKKVNSPSDDPGAAARIQQIQKTLETRADYDANLTSAANNLGAVDSTLGDVNDLLRQAQTLASANVGDDVSQDAKNAAATQVDSIYDQLLDLGNKEFEGSYLFAGDKLDQQPFKEFAGGVQFVGSAKTLRNQVDESTDASFQVNGADVWGALSTRIEGKTTLAPAVSATTRLGDLGGASGNGVAKGSIKLGNGTNSAAVDLSGADDLGDVMDAINAAGLGGVTASLNAAGTGLNISGGAGETITVADLPGGTTAADLGIKQAAAAGTPVVGQGLNAAVTPLTPLSALNGGAGIDTKGLKITNGQKSATVDLAGAKNVQDLINAVNGAGTGVQLAINDAGSGLTLQNTTQGTQMSVSENGGTTAADLGLRSFTAATRLSELNDGDGVRTVDGKDFSVADSAGKSFDVDLTSGDKTVQSVIDEINAAASTAGAGVTASFATTGNGIVLTDTAGGSAKMKLTALNASPALKDLGLTTGAAAGNTVTGSDVDPVQANGVFANVNALRTALRSGTKADITKAAENLQADYTRVSSVHGQVGARVQAIQDRQDRLADENISTKKLLSQLQDTDFTTAATQYSQLQTSLEATLRTTSTMLNMSLMDFIK